MLSPAPLSLSQYLEINKSRLSQTHHIDRCNKAVFEGSFERYYSIIYVTFANIVTSHSSASAFREQLLFLMPHLIQVVGLIYVIGSWADGR